MLNPIWTCQPKKTVGAQNGSPSNLAIYLFILLTNSDDNETMGRNLYKLT